MKKLFAVLLTALVLFSLAACEDGPSKIGGDDPILSKTSPTEDQWADVGISGTFTADVRGELAFSVVDNGEISMKWTDSDEASLDNTIEWLKGQGFTSYGGQTAQKTAEEGGKILSYTAEKTVDGTTAAGSFSAEGAAVMPLAFSLPTAENKTMIAESFYITEDFSVMGQSFKAGELYLDIYETAAPGSDSSLLAEWPASQILGVIGEGIPAYTGAAGGYQLVDSSIGYMKTVHIQVIGAGAAEATAYNELLAQNGYVVNDGVYEKTLSNGNVIQIMAFASTGYHPDTFQPTDTIAITLVLIKNSGAYASWSALDLSAFTEAGLPAYGGGTSFDLDDAMSLGGGIDLEQYEQIVNSLGAIEGMLDAEQRAELEAARKYLQHAAEIEAYVVTVYGTNDNEADAYEAALAEAGFTDGMKNTADHQYQVEVAEDNGNVMITIMRLPIEIADEIHDGNGGSGDIDDGNMDGDGGGSSAVTDKLDWNDMPTNVKLTIGDSYGVEYSVTKIGQDYLVENVGIYTYFQYAEGSWTEYVCYEGAWTQIETHTNIYNTTSLDATAEFIFGNDVSGYTKDENEQVAGQTCEVYTATEDASGIGLIISKTKKLNADGIVFFFEESTSYQGESYGSHTRQIILWDTSVTAFDISLPQ